MSQDFMKTINATYRILDFFPDGDPLKNKAKERVLSIMETLALDDVLMLEKYLELAKNMGWIQDMNFLIVKKEWGIIGASLKKDERIEERVRSKQIVGDNYSDRQNAILKILNRKEKVQVQDIIKEMSRFARSGEARPVTKRTIRRDLDDLLKRGEITRFGDFNQVFYQKSDRTHLLA